MILNKNSRYCFGLAFLLVGIISRVIPHMPNATALTFVSLASGFLLPRYFALLGILFVTFCSDALISYFYHYPLFGSWSLFTYSGFLGLALAGTFLQKITALRSYAYFLGGSTLFWVWTNFGVWLTSGMYAKSITGMIACYVAAIPFLTNQWLGDLIWLSAFILAVKTSQQLIPALNQKRA